MSLILNKYLIVNYLIGGLFFKLFLFEITFSRVFFLVMVKLWASSCSCRLSIAHETRKIAYNRVGSFDFNLKMRGKGYTDGTRCLVVRSWLFRTKWFLLISWRAFSVLELIESNWSWVLFRKLLGPLFC